MSTPMATFPDYIQFDRPGELGYSFRSYPRNVLYFIIYRLAVDMDIHGYIHGYIHVWI